MLNPARAPSLYRGGSHLTGNDLEVWFTLIAMIAERNAAVATTTTAEIDTPILGLVAACTF